MLAAKRASPPNGAFVPGHAPTKLKDSIQASWLAEPSMCDEKKERIRELLSKHGLSVLPPKVKLPNCSAKHIRNNYVQQSKSESLV